MSMVQKFLADFKTLGLGDASMETTLLYLAAISRMMARKLSVLLVGLSSQGKSTLLKAVEALLPPQAVLAAAFITKAAIMRERDLSGKVILFSEHANDPEPASVLRQLISEGCVQYRLIWKGRPTSIDLMGPTVILEATTDEDGIDFQNRNRALVLHLQTSPEELQKRFEAIKHRRTVAAINEKKARDEIIAWHQQFQQSLNSNLRVVIPYAREIHFASPHVHSQRFLENFLTLIEVIAFIEQSNREIKRLPNGEAYIEATLNDYAMAYQIICGVNVETGEDDLPDDAVLLLKDMRRESCLLGKEPFGRRAISERLPRWSYKKLRRLLPCLQGNEFLSRKSGQHNAAMYEMTEFGRKADLDSMLPRACSSLPRPSVLQERVSNLARTCPTARASITPAEEGTSVISTDGCP